MACIWDWFEQMPSEFGWVQSQERIAHDCPRHRLGRVECFWAFHCCGWRKQQAAQKRGIAASLRSLGLPCEPRFLSTTWCIANSLSRQVRRQIELHFLKKILFENNRFRFWRDSNKIPLVINIDSSNQCVIGSRRLENSPSFAAEFAVDLMKDFWADWASFIFIDKSFGYDHL